MTTLEIWLLAVGLAMDCFAVSITSGILLKRTVWKPMLTMAFFFGLFQGVMPIIGWFLVSFFSDLLSSVDHWIAFGVLAFLGGKMVRDSLQDNDECHQEFDPTRLTTILALAVATSIDAQAVGISFALTGIESFHQLLFPITIIGLVSFVLSLTGLMFGIRCGCGIARKIKAELWGGIILILIGTKILIEHLFF